MRSYNLVGDLRFETTIESSPLKIFYQPRCPFGVDKLEFKRSNESTGRSTTESRPLDSCQPTPVGAKQGNKQKNIQIKQDLLILSAVPAAAGFKILLTWQSPS